MSISTNFLSWYSNTESTESLVVHGISLTITRFSPVIALIMLDLPTFGLPMIASLMNASS